MTIEPALTEIVHPSPFERRISLWSGKYLRFLTAKSGVETRKRWIPSVCDKSAAIEPVRGVRCEPDCHWSDCSWIDAVT